MKASRAWYREPWPWLLMAGPATVIVAGAITAVFAFRSSDGLVADDYYKQGLTINRTIARAEAATRLRIRGEVAFEGGRARASLVSDRLLGDRIRLTLVAARSGADRVAMLSRDANGQYSAAFDLPPAGKWTLVLETAEWRLETPADLRSTTVAGVWAPGS